MLQPIRDEIFNRGHEIMSRHPFVRELTILILHPQDWTDLVKQASLSGESWIMMIDMFNPKYSTPFGTLKVYRTVDTEIGKFILL